MCTQQAWASGCGFRRQTREEDLCPFQARLGYRGRSEGMNLTTQANVPDRVSCDLVGYEVVLLFCCPLLPVHFLRGPLFKRQ